MNPILGGSGRVFEALDCAGVDRWSQHRPKAVRYEVLPVWAGAPCGLRGRKVILDAVSIVHGKERQAAGANAERTAERHLRRTVRTLYRRLRPGPSKRWFSRQFQTPWPGPRINIQKGAGGKAKQYQVGQVLAAIERMEGEAQ